MYACMVLVGAVKFVAIKLQCGLTCEAATDNARQLKSFLLLVQRTDAVDAAPAMWLTLVLDDCQQATPPAK
jgi:hypothetical protein